MSMNNIYISYNIYLCDILSVILSHGWRCNGDLRKYSYNINLSLINTYMYSIILVLLICTIMFYARLSRNNIAAIITVFRLLV